MARAVCPVCEELINIAPTGERQHETRGTSRWWRVDTHADKREKHCMSWVPYTENGQGNVIRCGCRQPCEEHGWNICEGSGRHV